jgi:hypothetical protein
MRAGLKPGAPARWPRFLCAPWLLVPGAASACGGEDGFDPTFLIIKFIAAALFFGWPIWMVWKAFSSRAPQSPGDLVFPGLSALWLAAMGMFFVPQFTTLFASFGVGLPLQSRLVLDYHYLLALPLVLFPFMWHALNGKPRRDGYFAALLAVDVWLTGFVLWALYLPIFKMC